MGGKIEAYLDCVSPYSYYALSYLQKNREALASYGVEVEYDRSNNVYADRVY